MNKKVFDNCFIVGRFQHIHKYHEKMINVALEMCKNVLILVGSAQESNTTRNPFNYEVRARLIKEIYGKKVMVAPLKDMTTEDDIRPEWGRYVLANVINIIGKRPSIMFFGKEENRNRLVCKRRY